MSKLDKATEPDDVEMVPVRVIASYLSIGSQGSLVMMSRTDAESHGGNVRIIEPAPDVPDVD
jgi:hypothetical protein